MPIKFDFAWRLQSVSSGFLECCIRKDSEVVPEIPVKAAIAHSCCSPLALIHVTLIYAVNSSGKDKYQMISLMRKLKKKRKKKKHKLIHT